MKCGKTCSSRPICWRQTIHVDRLESLSGTEADLIVPQYQRLKQELSVLRQAQDKCQFLYLPGRKGDGRLLLHVCSEPTDARNHCPPGHVSEAASAVYRRVFDTRAAAIAGPVSDHWRTWVTALVPILDPKTAMSGLATPSNAQAMVRKAVEYYRRNGRARLLKVLNDPQGEFHKADMYVFAYDRNMTMVAHPIMPQLVGQNQIGKKDWAGGKYFHREIQGVALSQGSGWVDYQWENPVSKQLDYKMTYFEGVGDLIVCAGAYKSAAKFSPCWAWTWTPETGTGTWPAPPCRPCCSPWRS